MISNSESQTEIPTAKPILDILWESYRPSILRAAIEMGVWSKVTGGSTTADEVAQAEGWDPTGTRMLLDVLCGMDLLDMQEGKYYLVPVAEKYLVPGEATYMGDYVLLDMGWEGFGQLAQAVRTGIRPINEDWTGESFATTWSNRFAPRRVAPKRGIEAFEAIWEKLDIKAIDGLRILDVACGSGIRTLALARQHPGVQVTLQELPPVLSVAVELAENLGVSEQFTTLTGDLQKVDFGQGRFDLVFMGHIVHFFGPSDVASLLRKSFTALVPRGELILAEMIADKARREAEFALLGAIWLYGVSAEGDMFTFSEISNYLEQAGFIDITLVSTGTEDFIKARRPKSEKTSKTQQRAAVR